MEPKATAGVRMTPKEKARIEADFKKHINSGQVRYLKAGHLDVIETQRERVHFTDPVSGRRMIDCFSAAGSFNVGRHNPQIMEALTRAVEDFDLGTSSLVSRRKQAFAQKLIDFAPGDLNHVLLCSGGGDAVECALKLARGATCRTEVISTVKAYHGHTGFALSASGKAHYRAYCEPLLEGFHFAPFNDLEAMKQLVTDNTAAIIIEPVQGEAGIFVGTTEYLQGLRELCDKQGIVLIFDEIQTGFGRTGKLFACEHSGVVPDIMTVAKSIGGGLFANGATLYRDIQLLTKFIDEHPYFHTTSTGGSDLGCVVSLKVLEFMEEHTLWENAARMGARLKDALHELMSEHPKIIKDVRGIGLMVGLEYIHEFIGPMMSDALAKQGLFAAYSGNAPQVMRFMVPITANAEDIDRMIVAIRGAVKDMQTLLPLALLSVKIPFVLKALNSERVQTSLFGLIRKLEDLLGGNKSKEGRA